MSNDEQEQEPTGGPWLDGIEIKYNPVTRDVWIHKNDGVGAMEAFGMLEMEKTFIQNWWWPQNDD